MLLEIKKRKSGAVVLVLNADFLKKIPKLVFPRPEGSIRLSIFGLIYSSFVWLKNWQTKRLIILAVAGLGFGIGLGVTVFSNPSRSLADSEYHVAAADSPLAPTHLDIPAVELSLPVVTERAGFLSTKRQLHWSQTSYPLHQGQSTVLVGDRQLSAGEDWLKLELLRLGDTLKLTAKNGGIYIYTVTEIRSLNQEELAQVQALPVEKVIVYRHQPYSADLLAILATPE